MLTAACQGKERLHVECCSFPIIILSNWKIGCASLSPRNSGFKGKQHNGSAPHFTKLHRTSFPCSSTYRESVAPTIWWYGSNMCILFEFLCFISKPFKALVTCRSYSIQNTYGPHFMLWERVHTASLDEERIREHPAWVKHGWNSWISLRNLLLVSTQNISRGIWRVIEVRCNSIKLSDWSNAEDKVSDFTKPGRIWSNQPKVQLWH